MNGWFATIIAIAAVTVPFLVGHFLGHTVGYVTGYNRGRNDEREDNNPAPFDPSTHDPFDYNAHR